MAAMKTKNKKMTPSFVEIGRLKTHILLQAPFKALS
jgi:hypothetical protein